MVSAGTIACVEFRPAIVSGAGDLALDAGSRLVRLSQQAAVRRRTMRRADLSRAIGRLDGGKPAHSARSMPGLELSRKFGGLVRAEFAAVPLVGDRLGQGGDRAGGPHSISIDHQGIHRMVQRTTVDPCCDVGSDLWTRVDAVADPGVLELLLGSAADRNSSAWPVEFSRVLILGSSNSPRISANRNTTFSSPATARASSERERLFASAPGVIGSGLLTASNTCRHAPILANCQKILQAPDCCPGTIGLARSVVESPFHHAKVPQQRMAEAIAS